MSRRKNVVRATGRVQQNGGGVPTSTVAAKALAEANEARKPPTTNEYSGRLVDEVRVRAAAEMETTLGEDLVARVAMGSDPLTPDERWGGEPVGDTSVGLPVRPGSDKRLEAQRDPRRWILAPDSKCPRCGDDVPQPGHKGEWRGALSRTDNRTEVCSACGTDEAYEQGAGALRPQNDWPVPPTDPRVSRMAPPGQVPGYHEPWSDIRGGQRAPRQPVPTPRELPDLRLHLMEKWLPGGIFARAIAEGDIKDTSRTRGPFVTQQDRNLASVLDSQFQRKMLEEASLWWVRDEMVDLVMAATKTTPLDLRGLELALPANQDAGMVMLAKPYVGTDAFNPGQPVEVDVMCWGRARAKMGKIPCISLCMYRYFDFAGGLSRAALEEAVTTGAIYDANIQRLMRNAASGEVAARLTGGAWVYSGRTDWPLADAVEGFDAFQEEAGLMSDMQKASMIEDRKFFASFCLLVNHKLSQVDEELAPRHVTRRVERDMKKTADEAREISKVKIVRLREISRKAGESAEDHEKRKVEWTHRWVSSGHWAWRWCGPRNQVPRARRRTFVSPSIKGPKDLPVVFKESVRLWSR